MADKYRVHGAQETTVPVQTEFKGRAVTAQLPVLIVELVGLEEHQRSITHVEVCDTPELRAAALSKFPKDAVLELGLSPVEEK